MKTKIILALALLICGCIGNQAVRTYKDVNYISSEAQRVGITLPTQDVGPQATLPKDDGTKAGLPSMYPDYSLTPGDIMTTDTNTICTKGYTTTVRDVSESLRRRVFQEYGISYPPQSGAYELDHFIPLELGGSNDITNLFPEPAEPKPGFHEKDLVENYLHKQVCDGHMTIQDAQTAIRQDWYKVYLSMKGLPLT
jgi:hypothetical protein